MWNNRKIILELNKLGHDELKILARKLDIKVSFMQDRSELINKVIDKAELDDIGWWENNYGYVYKVIGISVISLVGIFVLFYPNYRDFIFAFIANAMAILSFFYVFFDHSNLAVKRYKEYRKGYRVELIILFVSIIACVLLFYIKPSPISWIVNGNSHKIYNQNGYEIAQKLRNNVVQIRAIFTDKNSEDGFGFIVGERENNLYVVTAHHVVFSDDPDVKIKKIEAQFYQSKGKIYEATFLELSYSKLDIALLEIPKPEGYNWEKKYFYSQPETNDKVWFIGRSRDWYIPSDAATGSINRKAYTGEIYVDMRSVQPGTSGAPLITKKGIVGMIIIDSGNEATALNIGIIQNTITQEWNYPWGLEAFQDVAK